MLSIILTTLKWLSSISKISRSQRYLKRKCHFVKLENGSIRTKLYTSQVLSLQDEDTDNTEKNVDNAEVDIEVNCLRLGQTVAAHLKGKTTDIANVYMAMVCAC